MNTPADQYTGELRCAEYVLGVLDSDERRALERDLAGSPAMQADVVRWERHLTPLAEDVRAIDPPQRVWTRIRVDLGFAHPAAAVPRRGMWNNLDLWRWLGVGASVAAVALVAVNLNLLRELRATVPAVPSVPTVPATANYMVATIAHGNGVVHWTATVDLRRKQMIIVPAGRTVVTAAQSTELWLIPPNAKPIPLGVFASNQPVTVALPGDIVARMNPNAVLAVSLEPHGGSPTGQPTGPVLATGPLVAT